MLRRPLLATVVAAALGLGSTAATAEAPYGYWGFDLLATEMLDDDDAFPEGFDDTSAGLRLHGGYRPNDWIGVEGGIQSLGRFNVGDSRIRYSAATISGILYLPLATRTVDLFVRVGGGVSRISDRRGTDSDTKPIGTAGAGLQFHVNPQLALRLAGEVFVVEPTFEGQDGESFRAQQEIGTANLGLSFLF